MRHLPPSPSPGDRISATLMREVMRYIQASTPIAGRGLSSRNTPNGTILTLASDPAHPSFNQISNIWRIVPEEIEAEGATTVVHFIDRQYYQVGGLLQEGHDKTTLESFVINRTPFIAAVIVYASSSEGNNKRYSCTIQGFASFFEMQALSFEPGRSIIPLYELKLPEGQSANEQRPPITIKIDFRTIPVVQAFEMPVVLDNEEANERNAQYA